jgi:hypothetical protein
MSAFVFGIEPEQYLIIFNSEALIELPSLPARKDFFKAVFSLFNHCLFNGVHIYFIGGILKKHEREKMSKPERQFPFFTTKAKRHG